MKLATAIFALLALAGTAAAQEPPISPPEGPALPAINSEELESLVTGNAAALAIVTQQNVTGSVTNAQVNAEQFTTGDIVFTEGALSNFSGIGNIVANTGANSTIQGVVNVTVTTSP